MARFSLSKSRIRLRLKQRFYLRIIKLADFTIGTVLNINNGNKLIKNGID